MVYVTFTWEHDICYATLLQPPAVTIFLSNNWVTIFSLAWSYKSQVGILQKQKQNTQIIQELHALIWWNPINLATFGALNLQHIIFLIKPGLANRSDGFVVHQVCVMSIGYGSVQVSKCQTCLNPILGVRMHATTPCLEPSLTIQGNLFYPSSVLE